MIRLLLGFGMLVVSSILSAQSILNAQSIELTWAKPELREDGTQIQSIDRFNIYHTFDNVVQDSIEISADDTSYTLSEAEEGTHIFQISAVEDGQEGGRSPAASALVLAPIEVIISKPSYPPLTVRVVE